MANSNRNPLLDFFYCFDTALGDGDAWAIPGLAGEATAPGLARCAGAGRFRLLPPQDVVVRAPRGWIVGLAKNARINDQAARGMALAAAAYERTGEKQRVFADLCYGARSWSTRRRVIARLEHGPKGANPRYVITNLEGEAKTRASLLRPRRDGEPHQGAAAGPLRRPHQLPQVVAQPVRLILSSLAYTLIATIRRLGLRGTTMARAQADTIRLKLLKIGAVVIRNTRRVRLHLSSACPYHLVRLTAARLKPG